MNKEEALQLMLDSINEDNRAMCAQAGFTEEDTESQIAQSQPALSVILSNMYDKMVAAELIRSA